jgi:sphinganine-1-phosphate aldolase
MDGIDRAMQSVNAGGSYDQRGEELAALRRRLGQALRDEPTRWIGITTLRPDDPVRAAAYVAMGMVGRTRGGMNWESPAGRLVIDELTAFIRPLFSAASDAPVIYTTGGTESIFLGLLAAREEARRGGRSERREVLVSGNVHPSVDKGAMLLGLEARRVATGADLRADPSILAAAISERTLALVASAPSDAHGLCDRAPAIAALARDAGVWLHVDACLGGYLVPFLRMNEPGVLPPFDFAVVGVRSISACLHKYGYAPIGVSTLLLRDAADSELVTFRTDDWDGYAYATRRFVATRSFDAVAGAWLTAAALGVDGYRARAARIAANARELARRVSAIPGMRLLAQPEAGMVAFGAMGDAKQEFPAAFRARGHRGNLVKAPPGFVVCIGPERGADDLDVYEAEIRATLAAMQA